MQKINILKTDYEKGVSKYKQVKKRIEEFITINNLSEGYRFPNVDEIALMFGVSRFTANRAMEELAREGIIERRPGVGSILKQKRTKESIVILIPSLRSMEKEYNREEWFITQDVMQGVIKGLINTGIHWEILELSNLQSESQKINKIIERQCTGVLFLTGFMLGTEKNLAAAIKDKGIPVVIAYNIHKPCEYPSVFIDKQEGFKEGLMHLMKHGHRKIAFVRKKFPLAAKSVLPVYPDIFKEIGLEMNNDWLWEEKDIPYLKEKILKTDVTGIFFNRDLAAIEAIDILKKSGIEVGKDIAVVGYDNIEEASYCSPSLTTLDPHRKGAGYNAIKMLLAAMENIPAETIRMVPDLIIRESCGCTRQKEVIGRWKGEKGVASH